jgi:uncharacterized protein (TIGR00369 family)
MSSDGSIAFFLSFARSGKDGCPPGQGIIVRHPSPSDQGEYSETRIRPADREFKMKDRRPEAHTAQERISPERAVFLAEDFQRGFVGYCGFFADTVRYGFFESGLRVEDRHCQQDGFVHAGVMATMADHTAGYAAFTMVPETHQILTIEFKINFLRAASGNGLACRARVIRGGTRLLVAESEVFDIRDAGETLAAKAMVTLMAVSGEKIVKIRETAG